MIASGGVRVVNHDIVRLLRVNDEVLEEVARREQRELERRERALPRRPARPLDLRGRAVLLVDDGLATGASMRAAVEAVRASSPARIVVAAPVASRQARDDLVRLADEVVVATPEPFWGVGAWYDDFTQTDSTPR